MDILAAHAERTPDAPALVEGARTLTWRAHAGRAAPTAIQSRTEAAPPRTRSATGRNSALTNTARASECSRM